MKHVTQCTVQRVRGDCWYVTASCPPFLLRHCPTAPATPSFTRILHSYISQTFRNIFVLLTQSRFYTFLFASMGGGGWGGRGNWRIKHVRGTICVTWYMTASVELDKCFNEFIFMFCRPLLPSSSPFFPLSPGLHYLHGLCHSAIALPFTVGDRDHDICSRGQADTCHMPHATRPTVHSEAIAQLFAAAQWSLSWDFLRIIGHDGERVPSRG